MLAGLWLIATGALGADARPKKPTEPTKPAQPDVKFLEYLGTLEGDDENWTEIAAIALAAPAEAADPKGKQVAKPEAAPKPAAEKK